MQRVKKKNTTTKQKEPIRARMVSDGVSDSCQSLLTHMLRTAPTPYLPSSAQSSSHLRKWLQVVQQQPSARKQLPIPPLPTIADRSKRGSQKKKKKAQKKELDRAQDKTRVNNGVACLRLPRLPLLVEAAARL